MASKGLVEEVSGMAFLVCDPLCPETSCRCSILALQGTACAAAERLDSEHELLTWCVGIWAGQ